MLISFASFTMIFDQRLIDIKESQNIASLHNQITACDSILEVWHSKYIILYTDEIWESALFNTLSLILPSLSLSSSQRMEEMLSSFQSDLSSISSEIQTLQQQSVSMNMRLKNRQAVRSQLSQLVDELVVPGAMISWVHST